MTISMKQRLDMLQKASRAWLELTRTLDQLTDAQLLKPSTIGNWSGKDLIAHIAAREQLAADAIEAAEVGDTSVWDDLDGDAADDLLDQWRDAPLADVRQYLDDAHFTLMNLAETSRAVRPDLVLDVTEHHYQQHAGDFERLKQLPKQ